MHNLRIDEYHHHAKQIVMPWFMQKLSNNSYLWPINELILRGISYTIELNELFVSTTMAMTKSELIERLASQQNQLSYKDVELVVKTTLEHMAQTLSEGERIEIRGFGSFSLHYRAPRIGRNPKTGESVQLEGKSVPHFKPGKELRERVNQNQD